MPLPQSAWSDKRERQYKHIKEGLLERGSGDGKAEEIAARTVNKERARQGEAKQASRTSVEDISSGRRGGSVHIRARAAEPTLSCVTKHGNVASQAARG